MVTMLSQLGHIKPKSLDWPKEKRTKRKSMQSDTMEYQKEWQVSQPVWPHHPMTWLLLCSYHKLLHMWKHNVMYTWITTLKYSNMLKHDAYMDYTLNRDTFLEPHRRLFIIAPWNPEFFFNLWPKIMCLKNWTAIIFKVWSILKWSMKTG